MLIFRRTHVVVHENKVQPSLPISRSFSKFCCPQPSMPATNWRPYSRKKPNSTNNKQAAIIIGAVIGASALIVLTLLLCNRLRRRGAKAGSREESGSNRGPVSPATTLPGLMEQGIIREPPPVYTRSPDPEGVPCAGFANLEGPHQVVSSRQTLVRTVFDHFLTIEITLYRCA